MHRVYSSEWNAPLLADGSGGEAHKGEYVWRCIVPEDTGLRLVGRPDTTSASSGLPTFDEANDAYARTNTTGAKSLKKV